MLSQSHSVNTSIESCTTHLLRQEESQSQSDKNAQCERVLKDVSSGSACIIVMKKLT